MTVMSNVTMSPTYTGTVWSGLRTLTSAISNVQLPMFKDMVSEATLHCPSLAIT